MIVGLFVSEQVTLQLDRDPAGAEHSRESIDEAADAKAAAVDRCPPDERHQPAHVAIQIVEREGALAFRRAQLHPRDEPAQVAITLTRSHEQRKVENLVPRAEGDRQLRPDDRLQPCTRGGKMKSWEAVDTIAIEQRDRGIPELRRAGDERLRQRRPVEKGERGGGVKFDVHQSAVGSRRSSVAVVSHFFNTHRATPPFNEP